MKIVCNREKLLAAFQTASGVAPLRSPKPILRNVKLEVADQKATLIATDLEIGLRIEVPGIEIEAPGTAVLPIGLFGSILRESTDEKLRIESDGRASHVRGERSQFKLPSENPDEFPTVATFQEGKCHEVPARLIREIVRRTVFATDSESSRYALGGVLWEFVGEKVIAVATDGRRLARMEGPAHSVGGKPDSTGSTIVPTRAMQLIERALTDGDAEVQIAVRENDILIRSPRATIYSRLVEGRFPRWRDVFPDRTGTSKIEMVVGPLHAAVRQAMIVTSEESRGVDFRFGDGSLVLAARAADTGESRVELPISYDGAAVAIMLDPRYVSEFLRVLDPEKSVVMDVKDAEGAAVLTTDDGYGYVVMPLARDQR
jgi:DNA polymerase III subunit beta